MSSRCCVRMLRDASRLAEHQRTALARLAVILDRCGGAILADEPGLGKSFVAAALFRELKLEGFQAWITASLKLPSFLKRAGVDIQNQIRLRANPDEIIIDAAEIAGDHPRPQAGDADRFDQ